MSHPSGERRNRDRHEVRWDAECRLGGTSVPGLIRDANTTGVFFEPEREDGDPVDAAARVASSLFEPHDNILVTYTTGPYSKAIRSIVELRWKGFSRRHGCAGFGLEFERQTITEKPAEKLPEQAHHVRPKRTRVMTGTLGQIQLPSLLTILELEKLTGALQIKRHAAEALLYLKGGRVINALVNRRRPENIMDSLRTILDWEEGRFAFWHQAISVEDVIGLPTTVLLLELALSRDESSDPQAH